MKWHLFRPDIFAGFLAGIAIPLAWGAMHSHPPAEIVRRPAEVAAPATPPASADSLLPGRLEYKALRHPRFRNSLLNMCAIYLKAFKSAADPAEAERLLKLVDQTDDDNLRFAIIEGLVMGNPEWVIQHSAGMHYVNSVFKPALFRIYARDPAAAARYYSGLPDRQRNEIVQYLECRLAAQSGDLERISRYDSRTGSGGEQEDYLIQLMLYHPERIPEIIERKLFLRVANEFSEYGPTTVDILRIGAAAMSADDFLKWAANVAPKDFQSALLIAGGNMEPAELIARCKTTAGANPATEATLAAALAGKLVRKAPREGLQWLAGLEAGGAARNEVIQATAAFASAWYRARPDEAMAAALAAGGDTIMAEQIVREAFSVVPDSATALQKADAISDPRLKELALVSVLRNSASLKPDQALPALARITDHKALQTTVAHVFGTWSVDHPADAANWLKTNAPDYAPAAMDTVFLSWANEDAGAAAGWLRDLPPGPSRDAAANRLARQISARDPESALTWAGEVADQSVRTECLRHILSVQQKTGVDAKALMERPSLPASVREELKTFLPP